MQPTVALANARRYQALGTLATTVVCASFGRTVAWGALWGGALMALHLHLLHIIAVSWLTKNEQGMQPGLKSAAALLTIKFFVMAALTGAIMLVLKPHALGFLAGLSTFVLGAAGACISPGASPPRSI